MRSHPCKHRAAACCWQGGGARARPWPPCVAVPAARQKARARRYLGEGTLNNVLFVAASTVITGFISFTFFGLNAIGMEIEDPFGDDDNDLDL